MRRSTSSRSGFTIVEVVAALAVLLLAVMVLVVLIHGSGHGRKGPRTFKDALQLQALMVAMDSWAQNNRDRYPLPSDVDLLNTTVPELGAEKNTTANIMALLVHQGLINPDFLVSPAEASSLVRSFSEMQQSLPWEVAPPAEMMWDPRFRADFSAGGCSHVSYAHIRPIVPQSTSHANGWWRHGDKDAPVVGNRGPEVASIDYSRRGHPTPRFTLGTGSITLLVHGHKRKWEGHVAYADGRVDFLNEPVQGTFQQRDGGVRGDVLFADEPGALTWNRFLGIFRKAGDRPEDFVATWD